MQLRTDPISVDNNLIALGVINRFKVPASVCRWVSEIKPKSYWTNSDDAMSPTCILNARKYFGDKRLCTNSLSFYFVQDKSATARNSYDRIKFAWQINLFFTLNKAKSVTKQVEIKLM